MSAAALLAALLTLYPETDRTRCIASRAVEITAHADDSAARYGVPAEILLATGMLESALGCDPRSGGSWGAPISRTRRLVAGNSDHTASALALGYERCASWLDALSHFRTGRCSGSPPIGYTPDAAMRLAERLNARVEILETLRELLARPTRLTLPWPVDSFASMATETVPVHLTGAEYYQWMRNREGGQTFGTRTIVAPIDDTTFSSILRPHLRWGYASSAAAYWARHPHITHLRIRQSSGRGDWELEGVGSREALRPQGQAQKQFALQVTSFGTPSAIAWGRTADSDVYPIGSYELRPCSHNTDIPGRGRSSLFPHPLVLVGLGVLWVGFLSVVFDDKSEKQAAR